jgi:hypothetical protein
MIVSGIFWDSHVFGVDDKKASITELDCGSIARPSLIG